MLIPFLKDGWKVKGYDQKIRKIWKKNNLPNEVKSEKIILKSNSLDLILIAGSLEHCFGQIKF